MPDLTGQTVRTASQKMVTFDRKFGKDGGQGEVYFVRGRDMVAKILDQDIGIGWIDRCYPILIAQKLWTVHDSLQSLPQDTFIINGQLGHLSKLAKGKEFSEVLEEDDYIGLTSLESRLRLGLQLASGVRILHGKGIILADLCEQNLIIDVKQLAIRIIDVDGLGVVGRFPPIVQKARAHWPPEVKTRQLDYPDQVSELWSLAIVLHKLLLGRHPFPGVKLPDLWDTSTPIKYPVRRSHERDLRLLGSKLRNLIEQVFGYQRLRFLVNDRTNRPSAFEWERALNNALKSLRMCSQCGVQFVALFNNQKCPNCTLPQPQS